MSPDIDLDQYVQTNSDTLVTIVEHCEEFARGLALEAIDEAK